MRKTILITGATDGIGLETAKRLAREGHNLLLHGRNPEKLLTTRQAVQKLSDSTRVWTYQADFSALKEVLNMAQAIIREHDHLDVLINNAGVLRTSQAVTADGLGAQFTVNTIAPFLLTRSLLPLLKYSARVVNLSSAAQAQVDMAALRGEATISDDMQAYAQSKLALTMWTRAMSQEKAQEKRVFVAVNPGSLLGSKMVKQGFGVAGKDLSIGAKVLVQAALSETFAQASGQYFDNDSGRFSSPHSDALNTQKCFQVMTEIESILSRYL